MMLHTQQQQEEHITTTHSSTMISRHSIVTAIALQQATYKQQKQQQRWPQVLVGKLRLVKSNWSLSSAWSSDIPEPESECPIIRDTTTTTTTMEESKTSLPPSYSDPSHPWASQHIEQEEEEVEQIKDIEEDNVLPPYECTVSRVGHVHVKKERENQDKVAKKRSWRNLYIMLWGTSIRAYKREPKINQQGEEDSKPVWSYTMQQVEAGLATDYRKYKHVLRIRIHDGPQFLFRCETERSAILWIDAVQASANVCPDLDTRPMPEFSFGRRQRRNRRRQQNT